METKFLLDCYAEVTMKEVEEQAEKLWYDTTDHNATKIATTQDTLRRHMCYMTRKQLTIKDSHFKFGKFGDVSCPFKVIIIKVSPSS